MTLKCKLRAAAKHSIRFIYILYFACQIVSMLLTCLCVFFDTKINTLWLAVALPIVSLMLLSYYRRFIGKKKKPVMLNSAAYLERERKRAWLNTTMVFLFTTNMGLCLLAILSATGQSLSMQAIIDIYGEITKAVSAEGEILLVSFTGLIFLSRLFEMYLCKKMMQSRYENDNNEFGYGSTWDIVRQCLHTVNFAVSLALNTFLTVVALVTMGYYPSMSLTSYYIALGACMGLGLILALLETTFYIMDLQKDEDYKTLAVVSPKLQTVQSRAFREQSLHHDDGPEEVNKADNSAGRKTKDSEDSKDRWGIMMSMVDAICI